MVVEFRKLDREKLLVEKMGYKMERKLAESTRHNRKLGSSKDLWKALAVRRRHSSARGALKLCGKR